MVHKKLNKDLLVSYAIIGDEQIVSAHKIEVTNPYDGSVSGYVPSLTYQQIEYALDRAQQALAGWRHKTAKERSWMLRQWHDLILRYQDDLAVIMTLEQGKPLAEAKSEIQYAASFIEWFSEEAKRVYGTMIPSPFPESQIMVLKEPVGVCVAITPWNFPAAMLARKVAAALAAGCSMIAKPARETPFSALALGKLALEAGIPAGVLNIVTGDSAMIGEVFCASKIVRKLSFTGSTSTGKMLMRRCADTVKRLSLELGGNAPFIVFDDADIEKAVKGVIASKYRNMGQTCVCANRIFVQESIYALFTKELVHAVKALRVGNGIEIGIEQGPLINAKAIMHIEYLIEDARQKGATICTGGKRQGNCFEPTVVIDVSTDMAIAQEEIFGPVASLIPFKDEADVIALANDTQYGLASYVFTQDTAKALRVSQRLECGMVAVNKGFLSTEVAPFGGVKESGFGREGSFMGIEEYLETKYVLADF